MRVFIILSISVLLVSCGTKHRASNQFSDSLYVKLADLQDRRASSALLPYLKHDNAAIRKHAALAFGSIQDSTVVASLAALLNDDADHDVKIAAAFAIGQTSCLESQRILASTRDLEAPEIQAAALEAYGKVTGSWTLQTTSTDTVILKGIAWGIYRAGLNNAADSTLNPQVAAFLSSRSESVRFAAASHFARSATHLKAFSAVLINAAQRDESANVRMAAALALRKVVSDTVLHALMSMLASETSIAVRTNIIRSLGEFPLQKIQTTLIRELTSENASFAVTAMEALQSKESSTLWHELLPIAKEVKNHRVQGGLYEIIVQANADDNILHEIIHQYNTTSDIYHKTGLLTALGHTTKAFDFLSAQFRNSDTIAIRTFAMSALTAMDRNPSTPVTMRPKFAAIYRDAILSADLAAVGLASEALTDDRLNYKQIIKEISFLHEAKAKLDPAKDSETIASLESMMAYFEGREYQVAPPKFNHPIDWALVASVPRDQRATIVTEKGSITVRLLVEEAPGTVANFVALVKSGFFNGKVFHRIVPNFVIQSGCPRGDGFGGEDYSIRSEFNPRGYTSGTMGMASAGKDTESTQWFITHSPTPHLDGRYSIFAVLESGMGVVNDIEEGDRIMSVILDE